MQKIPVEKNEERGKKTDEKAAKNQFGNVNNIALIRF